MSDEYNTNWSDVPDLDPSASIASVASVSKVVVIHAAKASIRNAKLTDCYFELADPAAQPSMKWGAKRIEVKCLWYGRKPPTSWMHIAVLGNYEIIENYSGEVARDIGRK